MPSYATVDALNRDRAAVGLPPMDQASAVAAGYVSAPAPVAAPGVAPGGMNLASVPTDVLTAILPYLTQGPNQAMNLATTQYNALANLAGNQTSANASMHNADTSAAATLAAAGLNSRSSLAAAGLSANATLQSQALGSNANIGIANAGNIANLVQAAMSGDQSAMNQYAHDLLTAATTNNANRLSVAQLAGNGGMNDAIAARFAARGMGQIPGWGSSFLSGPMSDVTATNPGVADLSHYMGLIPHIPGVTAPSIATPSMGAMPSMNFGGGGSSAPVALPDLGSLYSHLNSTVGGLLNSANVFGGPATTGTGQGVPSGGQGQANPGFQGGGAASGGQFGPGQVRLVGEAGPELMVVHPDRTQVIPLKGLALGGSVSSQGGQGQTGAPTGQMGGAGGGQGQGAQSPGVTVPSTGDTSTYNPYGVRGAQGTGGSGRGMPAAPGVTPANAGSYHFANTWNAQHSTTIKHPDGTTITTKNTGVLGMPPGDAGGGYQAAPNQAPPNPYKVGNTEYTADAYRAFLGLPPGAAMPPPNNPAAMAGTPLSSGQNQSLITGAANLPNTQGPSPLGGAPGMTTQPVGTPVIDGSSGGSATPNGVLSDLNNAPAFQELRSGNLLPSIYKLPTLARPELGINAIPDPFQSAYTYSQLPQNEQGDYQQLLQSLFGITPAQTQNMANNSIPGWRGQPVNALKF